MSMRREGPGMDVLIAGLKELDGLEGKVGWFENAIYPNGTPVAIVAAVQEFGSVTSAKPGLGLAAQAEAGGRFRVIPPRPFMRPAVAAHGQDWVALLGKGAAKVLEGKLTARQVLGQVVLKAAGDVKKAIVTVTSPPLAASTIRHKKGRTKPLVDTNFMLNSVTGVVEDAKK